MFKHIQMAAKSDKEAFRDLLVELFVIQTAQELDNIQLPPPLILEKYRNLVTPKAELILQKYEQGLYVGDLCRAVIEDLKEDLIRRSRVAGLIEIALNVSALIISGLIALSQFIFDPVENRDQISVIYYTLLAVVALQLVGNLYLRYFDKKH